MYLSDSLAGLPIASAVYNMLFPDQQCMVNNAKGGKGCPLPAHSMHCHKPEVGRQVLANQGRHSNSKHSNAAVAGG